MVKLRSEKILYMSTPQHGTWRSPYDKRADSRQTYTEGETSDGKMSDGKTWTSDGKLQMAKADSVYQRTDPDSVVAKTEDWRTF